MKTNMIPFTSYLNEDASTYDLHGKYASFNSLYFDGKLPNIKLKWTNSSKLAGEVRVKYFVTMFKGKKIINSFEHLHLGISKYYIRDDGDIDGILLHEMIHVYLDTVGIHEGYNGIKHHGKEFMDKLKVVEKKSKIKISLTDNLPKAKLSKVADVGVVLAKTDKGYVIAVINKTTYNKNKDSLVSPTRWSFGNSLKSFRSGIVSNDLIGDYPVQRSVKNVGFYDVSAEVGDKLMKVFKDSEMKTWEASKRNIGKKIVITAPGENMESH